MKHLLVAALALAACDSAGGSDPGSDGGAHGSDAGSNALDGGGHGDGGGGELVSTLTSPCATLQGRAIVNHNGNLGISFTEGAPGYTFLGSISFELPDGFTGTVPNPEGFDGSSPRKVVALSTASFDTYGNHCWFNGSAPTGGSVTVQEFRPGDGVVEATFTNLQLRSCTGTAVCTVSGSIETTAEGVFD